LFGKRNLRSRARLRRRPEFQIGRNGIQAGRNDFQAERNKIQIGRNEIKIQYPYFSVA
jgi:hypothetical protein